MNEKFLAQLIAELKHAQGEAMALLTMAVCRQLDPAKLKTDLEGLMATAKQLQTTSPISLQIVEQSLAAAHAEAVLQKTPSEGPHPTRAN